MRRCGGRNIEPPSHAAQTVPPHDAPVHGERSFDAVVDAPRDSIGTRVVLDDAVSHRQCRRVVSVVGAADSSRLWKAGRSVVPDDAVVQRHGFFVVNAASARVSAHGAVVHRQVRVAEHARALRSASRPRVAAGDRQLVERAVARHVENSLPAYVLLDRDGTGDRQRLVDEEIAVYVDDGYRWIEDDRVAGVRVSDGIPKRSRAAVVSPRYRECRCPRRSREAEQNRRNEHRQYAPQQKPSLRVPRFFIHCVHRFPPLFMVGFMPLQPSTIRRASVLFWVVPRAIINLHTV